MDLDRRQHSRCEPAKLVYAQFGRANGGIVVNASLGGLRFQTVAPTKPSTVVQLTVSPSAEESFGVFGRIIWTDDSGKLGGLEFVGLTPEVTARLKDWFSQQPLPERLESKQNREAERLNSHQPGATIPADLHFTAFPATPQIFELPASYKPGTKVPRMFGSFTDSFQSAKITAPQKPRHWILRGVANGILVGVLLLLPAAYIYNFHPQLAYSLIDQAQTLFSGTGVPQQTEPQLAAPLPTGSSSAEPPPSVANDVASNAGASPSLEVQPEHAPPAIPAERSAASAEIPAPARTTVRRIAPRTERFRKASQPKLPVDPNDPSELWLAVGQGDTDAEVVLARLYATGRVVKKNCEQARVLLTAATKKGNADAIQELRQLLRDGCQ